MLPKKNRITTKELALIMQTGFFVFGKDLSLKYKINKEDKTKKIAFLLSKKNLKKAVNRNLLKRRSFAILKKNLHLFPEGFHGLFIFSAKSDMNKFLGIKKKDNNPFENLSKEIENLIKNYEKTKKYSNQNN